MKNLPKHKKLILFDGVCNLCNASVLYVIKRDKSNVFVFASLQSSIGKQLIEKYDINSSLTDSILLYESGQGISYKSTAALKITSKLTFPTNLLSVFLIIPSLFRDWVYDYIAKNRYKWYGKKDTCMIPTQELKDKFLD
ncbi:MAG: thiol-disulfide oxidoreductase [Bacteroidetes bacterium]|nr:MAG: thiol-disulfide oxidoreductase [Bacteroidota bacterium]